MLSNSPIPIRNLKSLCNFSNFNWRETNNNRIFLNDVFQIKIFIVGNFLDFSFYNWKMGSEIVAHNMNQLSFFLCNLVFWVDFIIKHQINIASNFYLIFTIGHNFHVFSRLYFDRLLDCWFQA